MFIGCRIAAKKNAVGFGIDITGDLLRSKI